MRCRMQHSLAQAARLLVYGLCVALFVYCGRVKNHVVCCDVDVRMWDERVEFVYENLAPQTMCDMDIVLHVNRTFKEKDLELEITLCTPDSLRYSERVKAPVSVEWGPTAEYFADVAIEYRSNVTLSHEGIYLVAIRPLRQIRGVESAGINFRMK